MPKYHSCRRAHLLLAEHEITRMTIMIDALSRRLGVVPPDAEELPELKQDIHPEKVVDEIEKAGQPSANTDAATDP